MSSAHSSDGARPFRATATVTVRPGADEAEQTAVCQALGQASQVLAGVCFSHAAIDHPGSVSPGQLTWDFAFRDQKARDALAAALAAPGAAPLAERLTESQPALRGLILRIDAALLETIAARVEWGGNGAQPGRLKRTNFVRVLDTAPQAEFMRWLRDVQRLADYVPAIKNWTLSRVRGFLGPAPEIAWTHCWEQEFACAEGLHHDYMLSPYHWGFLDGYYDVEDPRCIMDPQLTHQFCEAREGVLGEPD